MQLASKGRRTRQNPTRPDERPPRHKPAGIRPETAPARREVESLIILEPCRVLPVRIRASGDGPGRKTGGFRRARRNSVREHREDDRDKPERAMLIGVVVRRKQSYTSPVRESQRDSVPKPRVAATRPPWVIVGQRSSTPTGLWATSHTRQTKTESPQPRCG